MLICKKKQSNTNISVCYISFEGLVDRKSSNVLILTLCLSNILSQIFGIDLRAFPQPKAPPIYKPNLS